MKGQEAGTLLKEGDQREYHGACHYRTRSRGESACSMSSRRAEVNYVSSNLVYSGWVNRRRDREICHAYPHDDFLDDCARHHWIDHRRRRHPHVFAAGNRTIPSRRPHFFHARGDPGSLYLLQIADSFSSRVSALPSHRPNEIKIGHFENVREQRAGEGELSS